MPFSKILIANRGVIAIRICRTLRRMGIRSVVIFTEADADSLHVAAGDESVCIGAPSAYLDAALIVQTALSCSAQAIHPGYGFLSENADFAQLCIAHGLTFIGPTPDQMRQFGLKHRARALAIEHGVPVCQGSDLLVNAEHAKTEAARIGYPVMLKSTGGGGGIGMRPANTPDELVEAFDSVQRTAAHSFKDSGVFVESYIAQARHVEVQVFGDGHTVVALGERDCSTQRRNQKVIEETPAPHLPQATRTALLEAACRLTNAAGYENAGTVEFIVDASDPSRFFFLEVNTRLQVEHGVTEQVCQVDLVEWMVLQAGRAFSWSSTPPPVPANVSIQARIYAEDPNKDFQPNVGILTRVHFPPASSCLRVETWVETGSPVSPHYDPMLAKLIVTAPTREHAVTLLSSALAATEICGIECNLEYLRTVVATSAFGQGRMTTRFLASMPYSPCTLDVLEAGTQTSVQDYPGRLGYWAVGVPPSGPMDSLAFRTANALVGNAAASAAGLELTVVGPALRFNRACVVAVTGADMQPTLDGEPVSAYQAFLVRQGGVLRFKQVRGPGCRAYVAFAGGGLHVPDYLGSRATFALGNFGGHGGRILRQGDVLKLGAEPAAAPLIQASLGLVPALERHWRIAVLLGPQPDYFAPEYVANELFRPQAWKVHFNSNRLGVRLVGPKPAWARLDGGEAGLHPSNIHDNEYAIGSVNFTGDTAVILGLDGPSLGGFVCPITLCKAELWKIGQLFPGDTVTFCRTTLSRAERADAQIDAALARVEQGALPTDLIEAEADSTNFMLYESAANGPEKPALQIRLAGDYHVLLEYGPMQLDLLLRFRIHALQQAVAAAALPCVKEMSPGVRSLQIRFGREMPVAALVQALVSLDAGLASVRDMKLRSRIVHLPLAFECSTTLQAIETYRKTVKAEAPWLPRNVDFMRRINGLESVDAVKDTILRARYLVLGLGDVYLGAPCAVPLDPRTRLNTTKYNPARTWTAEGEVGSQFFARAAAGALTRGETVGGVYMCIYGMESPGGYQLVGRTVPVWSTYKTTASFAKPWLLDFFDQVQFFAMDEQELNKTRADFKRGRVEVAIESVEFDVAEYLRRLETDKAEIETWRGKSRAAFEQERERWKVAGVSEDEPQPSTHPVLAETALGPGDELVPVHVSGTLWSIDVKEGEVVAKGQRLGTVQAMKMELHVLSPRAGRVGRVCASKGAVVTAGDALLVLGLLPVDVDSLQSAYKKGTLSPQHVAEYLFNDVPRDIVAKSESVWLYRPSLEWVLERVQRLRGDEPLFGVFFACKDNIDVADMPTTAACPAWGDGTGKERSAFCVQQLESAGAVCVGKTNMDQFALGLVGVRSPFGAPRCVFDSKLVSGGSSSGSGVACALGLCSFSLGTDTAGSGRVPAAINGVLGYKPTRGLVSTSGVLPAMRSLDCVSVFATRVEDVQKVRRVLGATDEADVWQRRVEAAGKHIRRVGVPRQPEFFGDGHAQEAWARSLESVRRSDLQVEVVEVDFSCFARVAAMLYGSALVSERLVSLKEFLAQAKEGDVHPVTREILNRAGSYAGWEVYAAQDELQGLRATCAKVWTEVDCLLVPSIPRMYTVDEVQADPILLNSNLGTYTNFVNLLDLCAVAVPAVRRTDALASGVTIIAQAGEDDAMLRLAAQVHRKVGRDLGGLVRPVRDEGSTDGLVRLCVMGAHMRGMPLSGQLLKVGAVFQSEKQTRPGLYRMYKLSELKPGVVRVPPGQGGTLTGEVWALSRAGLGEFVATCVAKPLSIGTVLLQDGDECLGFLCEMEGVRGMEDCTEKGSWRAVE